MIIMHQTFELKQRLYYLQNSYEFKCNGQPFIHHKYSRKHMFFILLLALILTLLLLYKQ